MEVLASTLVRLGLLDEKTVGRAVLAARERGLALQVLLVRDGLLDEETLLDFFRNNALVPEVTLGELERVQPWVVDLVPESIARRCHLVPLRVDDQGHLVVAMSNPMDTHAVDELSYRTGLYVVRCLAKVSDLDRALQVLYGPAASPGAEESEQDVVLLTKVKVLVPPRRPESAAPDTPDSSEVLPLTKVKAKDTGSPGARPAVEWSLPRPAQEDEVRAPSQEAQKAKTKTLRGLPAAGSWQPAAEPGGTGDPALSRTLAAMERAHHRDQVVEALLDYLETKARKVLFLAVTGKILEARSARGIEDSARPLEAVRLLPDGESASGRAMAARSPTLTELGPSASDRLLALTLGVGPGEKVLLIPLPVRGRIVALICAARLTEHVGAEFLAKLAVAAERAFERILASRKR